ncbi:MAG: hypothetical protein V3U35_02510, partial [Candidatus Neomarinimicrobiota bacterium]
MIPPRASYRGFLLFLGSFRILFGGAADSVHTRLIQSPDFLLPAIAAPLPRPQPQGLNLMGWSYHPPADSTRAAKSAADSAQAKTDAEQGQEELFMSTEKARDVLRRTGAGLVLPSGLLNRWWEVDSAGLFLTIHQDHDGTPLKLPSTVPLAWYVTSRLDAGYQTLAQDMLSAKLQPAGPARAQRRGTIELLGADIAGQRVSLRVSGNVALNGNLSFQDRSKSYTNFRADQNWDVQVNQKQRFDIEGTIGDRVSVLVHQDSENDFEWENAMKIAYKGDEDEILQRIDAGNISLSLPGTRFATGGSGKSSGLFGIKAQTQLGPVNLTTIASIERSRKSSKSNTLDQEYIISDMLYVQRRYFFLDTLFRENYYPLTLNDPRYPDGSHTWDPDRFVKELDVYRTTKEV